MANNFIKKKMSLQNFLDSFEIREESLLSIKEPIKSEYIDYGLLRIELDKLSSLKFGYYESYGSDIMLTSNGIKSDYSRFLKAVLKTSAVKYFTTTNEILDGLKVEKLKVGGILSKIPLLGGVFSYDIGCFTSRLNVYSSDILDERKGIINNISLYKKAISESSQIIRKIEESKYDYSTTMAALEQFLFNKYAERSMGVKLSEWLRDERISALIKQYNLLSNNVDELKAIEQYVNQIKNWIEDVIKSLQSASTSVYGDGLVEMINRLNNLNRHSVKIQKCSEHWLHESDGTLIVGVDKVRVKINEISKLILETDKELVEKSELLVEIANMSSSLKYNAIEYKFN